MEDWINAGVVVSTLPSRISNEGTMNKNEKAFLDNLIRNCKANGLCINCNEIVNELKLLQSGKVTSRQVRLTCLND